MPSKKAAGKGKEKKAARAAAAAQHAALVTKVRAACVDAADGKSPVDVTAPFQAFLTVPLKAAAGAPADAPAQVVRIQFFAASTVPTPVMDAGFELTKTNMHDMYVDAGWGWNDKTKRQELTHEDARYLVVRGPLPADSADLAAAADAAPVVGFVCFRFELDEDDRDVLYLYEMQLAPEMRRHGIGRRLMALLELAARKQGMSMVVLTVFKANTSAIAFYSGLKYVQDETSPELHFAEEYPYVILSKAMPQPKPAASTTESKTAA